VHALKKPRSNVSPLHVSQSGTLQYCNTHYHTVLYCTVLHRVLQALCMMYGRDLVGAVRALEEVLQISPLSTVNETLSVEPVFNVRAGVDRYHGDKARAEQLADAPCARRL